MFGSCCCPQRLWVPVPQLVDWEEGRGFITRIPKRPKQILQLGWVSNIEQLELVRNILYLVFVDSQAQIQLSLNSQKTFCFSFANGTMIHLVIRVCRKDARRGRGAFFCIPLPNLHNLWLTPHGTAVSSLQSPAAPCGCFLPPRQNPQSSQFPLCGLSVPSCLSEGLGLDTLQEVWVSVKTPHTDWGVRCWVFFWKSLFPCSFFTNAIP